MKGETVTLNGKEQQRVMVLNRMEREQLTGEEAAQLMGLSLRQARRLLAVYRRSVNGGDKKYRSAAEWCPTYLMTSGPMVGGAGATLRMQEEIGEKQALGKRHNMPVKVGGNLIDGIDEDLKTAGPMCGLKPAVQEISVEARGQLAFPPGAALSSSILLAFSSAHPCSSSASCHDEVPSAK